MHSTRSNMNLTANKFFSDVRTAERNEETMRTFIIIIL